MFLRFFKRLFFSVLWANTQSVFADDKIDAGESHIVDRDVLELVDGLPKPPFIIKENGRGIQLEIVRDAFATINKPVKFIHVPF